MKRILAVTSGVLGLFVLVLSVGGCATPDLDDFRSTQKLPVAVTPSERAELPPPLVTLKGNTLKVAGVVRRKPNDNAPVDGHVHIDLLASDGTVLDSIIVHWEPESIPTDGSRQSEYSVNYYWQKPAKADVKVSIATDQEEDDSTRASTAVGSGRKTGGARSAPRARGGGRGRR